MASESSSSEEEEDDVPEAMTVPEKCSSSREDVARAARASKPPDLLLVIKEAMGEADCKNLIPLKVDVFDRSVTVVLGETPRRICAASIRSIEAVSSDSTCVMVSAKKQKETCQGKHVWVVKKNEKHQVVWLPSIPSS
jgi:hypothetical protein